MAELSVDYDADVYRVVLQTDADLASSAWFQQLRRALQDQTHDVQEPVLGTLAAPWWSFSTIRTSVGAILTTANVAVTYTLSARTLLQRAAARKKAFQTVNVTTQLTAEEVQESLIAAGWKWNERRLTNEQMRNVRKLALLPAAATFSVPGAGKTTEAIAYFFLRKKEEQRLLVVAPKNAFAAWEEQMAICMGTGIGTFVRLRSGVENIADLLDKKPRFMLITYQQLARVQDLVAQFITQYDTFVFLDESHKIKSGRGKVTPDAILRMSHLPVGKLILSGTPMPQSSDDLIPQFEFLYPEIRATAEDVVARIQPVFVRTHKGELKIPAVIRPIVSIPLNPAQKRLYDLMRFEVARQADRTLNQNSRAALRSLGRSVMRLLEVVSNPSLLARDIGFLHDELLGEVLAEGAAPKVRYACERARRLAKQNAKSIIWTTFRQNVESVADQLRDLNAVYIHGGIDAGDEDDDNTREGRLRQFRSDPNCFTMVANPAAAGEGISLHSICRHAIYIDRTYNAAHYLQSEDRIHRLGLLPHESPTVEILCCPGTIDESVQIRLETKVQAMATALEDPSLTIRANQYVPFDADDDPESESAVLDFDDVRSILQWLREGK